MTSFTQPDYTFNINEAVYYGPQDFNPSGVSTSLAGAGTATWATIGANRWRLFAPVGPTNRAAAYYDANLINGITPSTSLFDKHLRLAVYAYLTTLTSRADVAFAIGDRLGGSVAAAGTGLYVGFEYGPDNHGSGNWFLVMNDGVNPWIGYDTGVTADTNPHQFYIEIEGGTVYAYIDGSRVTRQPWLGGTNTVPSNSHWTLENARSGAAGTDLSVNINAITYYAYQTV